MTADEFRELQVGDTVELLDIKSRDGRAIRFRIEGYSKLCRVSNPLRVRKVEVKNDR